MTDSLREALIKGAKRMMALKPHYRPVLVSPCQYEDAEFMELVKLNYPNGMIVWSTYCEGCSLCD